MKLTTRILISYLTVFGIGFFILIQWVLGDLRLRYLESAEEVMVDQANLLAVRAGQEMARGTFDPETYREAFDALARRHPDARIYSLLKNRIDTTLYITDRFGRVLFHAGSPDLEGADFSAWRDVALTLKGRYGARSTRWTPDDPLSNRLYVAAPIVVEGAVAGVVTLIKPTRSINRFIVFAKAEVIKFGFLAALATALASYLTAWWLTRPVKRLTRYAADVRDGRRARLPPLDNSEIGVMGRAIDDMREALEGKRYVEQYIQTFTHEIKSPLSAIGGAAELLQEPMPESQRRIFLGNIQSEVRRIQQIIDRLLHLAELENRRGLERIGPVNLKVLTDQVAGDMAPLLTRKSVTFQSHIDPTHQVQGDAFLLRQAVTNLLQNALDFTPAEGEITITSHPSPDGHLRLTITDTGTGIPDYALSRVFDKFYSLHRPDTGKKGSGLGLNFVREVAELHGGSIEIRNRPGKGVEAVLILPVQQP